MYIAPSGQDHKFFDPFLKVYVSVPMMLNDNLDVINGKANGTVGTLSKMVLTWDGPDAVQPHRPRRWLSCQSAGSGGHRCKQAYGNPPCCQMEAIRTCPCAGR